MSPLSVSLRWLFVGLLLLVVPRAADAAGKPLVVVTVPPQSYFVRQLAKDLVDVEVLLPPGTNHETFEPTIGQAKSLAAASLVLTIGHPHFTVEKVLLQELHRAPPTRVVKLSDGYALDPEDIHLWTSPKAARAIAAATAAALIEFRSDWRAAVESSLQQLLRQIDQLEAELKERLAPFRGRSFLVFHPGWGYFANDFGLTQLSIEHDGKEPGPFQLAALVKEAKRRSITRVYIEPSFARASAEVIARELGGKVEVLDPMADQWEANLRRTAEALVRGFEERSVP